MRASCVHHPEITWSVSVRAVQRTMSEVNYNCVEQRRPHEAAGAAGARDTCEVQRREMCDTCAAW